MAFRHGSTEGRFVDSFTRYHVPMSRFRMGSIDHVHVTVPDREAAFAWYAEQLGFELFKKEPGPGDPWLLSADAGTTCLALFSGEPSPASVVAFRVDAATFLEFAASLDESRLEASKGRPLRAEDASDHHSCISFYFDDPWGHPYELVTYDHAEVRAHLLTSGG